MMSMDAAARALDAMLHQGYAEERDGGVWVSDLAAQYLGELRDVAYERDVIAEDCAELTRLNDAIEDDLKDLFHIIRRVADVLDELPDDADGEHLNECIDEVLTIIEPARPKVSR
jgi:hypothetical protein